jgi:DNA-directed RNA polymerase subunit RPC12/RpoP
MRNEEIHVKPCPKCGSRNIEGEVIDWLQRLDSDGETERWLGVAEGRCLDCSAIFPLEAEGIKEVPQPCQ